MKIGYGIFFAMLLCCQLMAQQSSTPGKEVDLSGPWIIDGERVELKLNAEMSTVRKVYCGGDRMTQLKCLWVAENTLRYEVSNQGFGLLNCSASYEPEAPEMKGPCVFGNRPTPKGFTAIRQGRGTAQSPGVSTQPPSGPAKSSPIVDAVAKAMGSSVNVSRYPREAGGTKYGLSYLVALAKSSTGGGGFAAAMSLPDAVVAPINDLETTKEFNNEWFREMDRLGLSEVNPTRYEAIALMKDINSRQQDYLARAKLVTRDLIAEWQPATKFNGGNVMPLVLGVLIIQHDELFKEVPFKPA